MGKLKDWVSGWLLVPTKVEAPKIDEEILATVDKLNSELAFWKQWFKSRTPKKKCTKCKQEIDVWPFNKDVAYYIKGNRVTHQTCPAKPLKETPENALGNQRRV